MKKTIQDLKSKIPDFDNFSNFLCENKKIIHKGKNIFCFLKKFVSCRVLHCVGFYTLSFFLKLALLFFKS